MKRSSFVILALCAAALCASCSGSPRPAPKSATGASAKGANSAPVIEVPARAASKVSLPGLWYSSKGHESYQIVLLADGSYLTRGRNPSGLDIEDKGVWTVSKDYLNTKSERGEERIWRIEFASEDKIILKSVKVRESILGELIEFDRVGARDIVGVWLDETGDTHYRLILTVDGKYVLEGTKKAGEQFRDSGTWRISNMLFIAKSGSLSEERIYDFRIGEDLRSFSLKNLVVKEGELGREMAFRKAEP